MSADGARRGRGKARPEDGAPPPAADAPAAAPPAAEPPAAGPLGLAARLRRETPAHAVPVVRPSDEDDEDAPARWEPVVRVPLRERLRARDAAVEILLFRVGGDLFATDLLAVEEALELGDVHPVPGAPPAMLGVLGLRGRLLPVYSPERALAHRPPAAREGAYVLVLRATAGALGPRRPVAIVVDDVEDVHTADLGDVQDLATAAKVDAEGEGIDRTLAARAAERSAAGDVVLGVLHWNGELVALVDTDALVAACAAGGEGTARDLPAPETL